MSSPDSIVDHSSNNHTARHQTTVIHRRRLHGTRNRPAAKEEDDHPEQNRDDVDDGTENAGNVERAPYQLALFTDSTVVMCLVWRVWRAEGSSHAAVEEEGLGDDVGSVEAADAEGNDVVESGR